MDKFFEVQCNYCDEARTHLVQYRLHCGEECRLLLGIMLGMPKTEDMAESFEEAHADALRLFPVMGDVIDIPESTARLCYLHYGWHDGRDNFWRYLDIVQDHISSFVEAVDFLQGDLARARERYEVLQGKVRGYESEFIVLYNRIQDVMHLAEGILSSYYERE